MALITIRNGQYYGTLVADIPDQELAQSVQDPQSIKSGTTITGDGVTNQYDEITTLFASGANRTVVTGTYLMSSGSDDEINGDLILRGIPGAVFSRGNASSGATMMNMVGGSLDVRDLTFKDGGVWFDMDNLTGTYDSVIIKDCVFDDVSCGYRWGDTSPGASAKINHTRYQDNWCFDNSRGGPFLDGHGSANTICTGNLIEDTGRFGIAFFGRTTSQNDGFHDRIIVANNIVRGLTVDSNTALCYLNGKYVAVIGNHFHEIEFNNDPDATDVEGIYTKCKHLVVIGNTLKNAGGGDQGYMTAKGGKRDGTMPASGPNGWNSIWLGNVCVNDGSQYNSNDGAWIQSEDATFAFNLFDGLTGVGIRNQDAGYKNQAALFNSFVGHLGTGILFTGEQVGARIQGNLQERGSLVGSGFRLETSGDDIRACRVADNTFTWFGGTYPSTGTIGHLTIRADNAGDVMDGVLITGNLVDASGPTTTDIYGINFSGEGTFQNILVANNIFKDMPDATKVIATASGTPAAGTIRITDSNLGFANWVKGTAQIDSGTSSEAVTHGLAVPEGWSTSRSEYEIKIVPTSPLVTAHSWAVSAYTATGFTVSTYTATGGAVNVGANFTFDWEIYKREWSVA